MSIEVMGIRIPDSTLANEATEIVREATPLPLFNHCIRTFVFAASMGKKIGKSFDAETLYLASVMHDLGLVETFIRDARFELDGADAAQNFLHSKGYPPEKIAVVWEAIALHASMEIPLRRQAEVALLHMGAFMDGGLMNIDAFPTDFYEGVFEAIPRLNSRQCFIDCLGEVIKRKPRTAHLSFMADVGRRNVPGFQPPHFCDYVESHPFNQ